MGINGLVSVPNKPKNQWNYFLLPLQIKLLKKLRNKIKKKRKMGKLENNIWCFHENLVTDLENINENLERQNRSVN